MRSAVLTRLREDTASLHHQIEQNRFARALVAQSMTITQYSAYLKKFYGFIKPLEQQIANSPALPALTASLGMEERWKLPWLEHDLRQLGLDETQLEALPICTALPDTSTAAGILGCMYVLEGSTLGGQIIVNKLAQTPELSAAATDSSRYFNSYGADTRSKWGAFRQALLDAAHSEQEEEQIVDAAKSTFLLLDDWIAIRMDA